MKLKDLILLAVLLAISSFQLTAQNQSPQVTNVIFNQRTDGSFIVDVYYDLNDPEGSFMTVNMRVSSDNGVTWDFSCNSITGDVGANITSGTGKNIEWNFASEHPQTFSDQFKIKIIADDGETAAGVPCPGIPTVYYEGKIYHTVQVGNQCWLKENLDVGTRINGNLEQTNNSTIEKYCYGDDPANCTTYGGLYQWNEAMQYVTNQGTKGICPDGWHLPTLTEFQTLLNAVGGDGNKLIEIGQDATSTNTSGFSALVAGYRDYDGYFDYLGVIPYFWSSTEYDATNAYYLLLGYYGNNIYLFFCGKGYGFSVRCVKD